MAVGNGCGMEAVAVVCCEYGITLFDREGSRDVVALSRDEFEEIAGMLREKRAEIQRMEDFLVERDLWDRFVTSGAVISHGRRAD